MLNKPRGVITARRDARHKTVMDLFDEEKRNVLFPVGRLDKDTEGLLIVTDDGALPIKLMMPQQHVPKKYFFWAKGSITPEQITEIEGGVSVFVGSDAISAPSSIEVLCTSTLGKIAHLLSDIDKKRMDRRKDTPVFSGYVTVTEGKKHQVKRMLGYAGCRVVYLKRVGIGNLLLDENLSQGDYRPLTEAELLLLTEK